MSRSTMSGRPNAEIARETLAQLVFRFGSTSGAFQALEPHFLHWFADDEAAVAYVSVRGAWVAQGPPLCAPERAREVVQKFNAAAARQGRRGVWFGLTPQQAQRWELDFSALGAEAYFEKEAWQRHASTLKNFRSQIRRAARLGVRVTQIDGRIWDQSPDLRAQLHALAERWMALHAMPPMGFVVALHPFDQIDQRRIFVAYVGEIPVGFASAVPFEGNKAWLVEDIVRTFDAPNGCAESLIDGALSSLFATGATKLSLGIVPLCGPMSRPLRVVRYLGRGLYNFEGLLAFKSKMGPTSWETIGLAWQQPKGALRRRWAFAAALLALLRAFAHGRLSTFAAATLWRGPRPILLAMVVALLPWTLGLILLPAAPYFPHRAVQYAWFVFDMVLWVALVALCWRPRRPLRLALAIATSCDTLLTLMEALYFPEPRGPWGMLLKCAAVLAPGLATLVLWGSWHRLRVMQGKPLSGPRPDAKALSQGGPLAP